MQHSRFTEQQIAFVLDQVARGASVEDTCRKAGISSQTYYRWRAKYAGLKPAEIRCLHEIEDENKRLKRLLAALLVVKPAPTGTALVPQPSPPQEALLAPAAGGGSDRYWQSLSTYLSKLPTGHGLDLRLVRKRCSSVLRPGRLPVPNWWPDALPSI
jgi:putative transposase